MKHWIERMSRRTLPVVLSFTILGGLIVFDTQTVFIPAGHAAVEKTEGMWGRFSNWISIEWENLNFTGGEK